MRILAIETSCDETAAAIVEDQDFKPVVLTNIVTSQLKVHAKTGGVIPNVAARMHAEALPAVLAKATKNQKLNYDAVAVTVGPGLIGCLLQGVSAAKSIALVTGKPFFAINHMEGHIYSAWLAPSKVEGLPPSEFSVINSQFSIPELPALVVIVSGGHTELVLMERHLHYKLLGATRDDAAGEAFDKVARLLDLPYPGGPEIAKLAVHGKRDAYDFPIGLHEKNSLEFSFSGLKASVYHLIEKLGNRPAPHQNAKRNTKEYFDVERSNYGAGVAAHTKADIAASFEATVVNTIIRKTLTALKRYPGVKSVCLVGGVAANHHLRVELEKAVKTFDGDIGYFVPELKYCTDNAAMIGSAAIHHHLFGKPDSWSSVEADPN